MAGTNGILGTLGAALSGDVLGAIGSAANGIGNAYAAMIPKSKSTGIGGSYAQFLEAPRLDAQFFTCVDDDINQNGRPLCKIKKPNTIPGYMKIQDGDVPIDGTAAEAKSIREYLEGGFYYE